MTGELLESRVTAATGSNDLLVGGVMHATNEQVVPKVDVGIEYRSKREKCAMTLRTRNGVESFQALVWRSYRYTSSVEDKIDVSASIQMPIHNRNKAAELSMGARHTTETLISQMCASTLGTVDFSSRIQNEAQNGYLQVSGRVDLVNSLKTTVGISAGIGQY
jgi:hypothetical protein